MIKTELQWLNNVNGADKIAAEYHQKVLDEFKDNLVAVVMGSAYGGELEYIARLWGDKGKVYGFDVFDDLHPKHICADPESFAATCMDYWYGLEEYGRDKMKLEYQQGLLDGMKMDNVKLIKGLVDKDSCKDIKNIHYAFLDMDMVESMSIGFEAVKDNMAIGGYLFLHDTQNIPEVGKWYREVVLKDKRYKQIFKGDAQMLVGLQRVSPIATSSESRVGER